MYFKKVIFVLFTALFLASCGGNPPDAPVEPAAPSQTEFQITEESSGISFTISNYDTESSVVIQGAVADLFTIQVTPVGGETNVVSVVIAPKTQFDYETMGSNLDITILIQTNPLVQTTHNIAIAIEDVVEEAPKFLMHQTVRAENTLSTMGILALDDNDDNFVLTLEPQLDYQEFSMSGLTLSFLAPPNYEVKDTYSVRIKATETTDENGIVIVAPKSSFQDIVINITDVNDPAIISIVPSELTDVEVSRIFQAYNTDEDATNNIFQVVASTTTTKGTYSISNTGLISYTINPALVSTIRTQLPPYKETDVIVLTSQDQTTYNHPIDILATNHPHILYPDTYEHPFVEAQNYTLDVLANDTDVDSSNFRTTGTLSATSTNASITISNQQLVYLPVMPTSYPFTDTITYTFINDGFSRTSTATMTLTAPEDALLDTIILPASTLIIEPPVVNDPTRYSFQQITLPATVGGINIIWSSNYQNFSFTSPTEFIPAHPPVSGNDLVASIIATITDSNNIDFSKTFPITIRKKSPVPSTKQLIIRVDFPNSQFVTASGSTTQMVSDMMFKPGDSAKDFFSENSFGYTNMQPAILPATGSPSSITDIDPSDGVLTYRHPVNAGAIIASLGGKFPAPSILSDALTAIDSYVDFSQFDTNNNGILESIELNIVYVFATCSRHFSSPNGCACPTTTGGICYDNGNVSDPGVWPASSYFGSHLTFDGKGLGGSASSRLTWVADHYLQNSSSYILLPEFNILSHEIGHNMWNIGDLYNGTPEYSINSWGLMGSSHLKIAGVYKPQHMTANNKIKLGFIDPIISTPYSRAFSGSGESLDLTSFASTDVYPVLITNQTNIQTIHSNQYLLAEVRDLTKGYDRALDGITGASTASPTGLLITHITPELYGNSSATNFRQMHQQVRNRNNLNQPTDWPEVMYGSTNTLTTTTTPNTNFHSSTSDFSQNSGINVDSINIMGDKYTIILNN